MEPDGCTVWSIIGFRKISFFIYIYIYIYCIGSVFGLVGTRPIHCVVCCQLPKIYAPFASCLVWSEPDGYTVPLVYDRLPNRCVAVASCLVWFALCLVWFGFGVASFGLSLDLIRSVGGWVRFGFAVGWV